MLCNNLAINYRCYNDQRLYAQALELHARGIAASSFAEHYQGILRNRILLGDNPGVAEAAEQLWHYAADYGYGRHDPEEYLEDVARALYRLDREREILIWLERILKWQQDSGVSDKELEYSPLFARLKVAMYLSYSLPEAATSLWLRYAPYVDERQEPSLLGCAGDVLKGLGRNEEAVAYYQRAIERSDPNNAVDQGNNELFRQSIAALQAPAKPAGKAWWQIWK
jgi:tetratricopeptide (TPR) repeat protein